MVGSCLAEAPLFTSSRIASSPMAQWFSSHCPISKPAVLRASAERSRRRKVTAKDSQMIPEVSCLKLSWLDHIGSYWIILDHIGSLPVTPGVNIRSPMVKTMGTWSRFTVGFCTFVLAYGNVYNKHHTPTSHHFSIGRVLGPPLVPL